MDSNLIAGLTGAVAAIIGVIVGGLVPWKVQQRAEDEGKLRDFRETMLRIMDGQERRIRELGSYDDPLKAQMEVVLSERMRILRSIAESLAVHIPDRLSVHDRVQLGQEYQMDSDYEVAHHHYTEAVALAAAEDPVDRAIALRHLARLYYVPTNPRFNPAVGAQTYEQAIAATAENADPYAGKYVTGRTYFLWAQALASIQSSDWVAKAALARRTYESIPDGYQYRHSGLRRLTDWEQTTQQGGG